MSFLDLLYDQAPRAAFDRVIGDAEDAGVPAPELAELRRQYDVALRLRDLIANRQAREAEMRALYETASDLTAIRDVDSILAAIVRRARQLLNADMTYLSLNDEADGASYMKVTDGALTPEFRSLRLPLGTGLLGLVAQTGAPYFTEDYQSDARFLHRGYIDDAVAGEEIRAILGVPLTVDGRVIGALLAVHREVRPFPPHEVTLLTSFAAHASVALENARLFADLDAAHRTMTDHTAAVESAAPRPRPAHRPAGPGWRHRGGGGRAGRGARRRRWPSTRPTAGCWPGPWSAATGLRRSPTRWPPGVPCATRTAMSRWRRPVPSTSPRWCSTRGSESWSSPSGGPSSAARS